MAGVSLVCLRNSRTPQVTGGGDVRELTMGQEEGEI